MAPASPRRLAQSQGLEDRRGDTPGFGKSIVSLKTVHRGAGVRIEDTVGVADVVPLLLQRYLNGADLRVLIEAAVATLS